jgi:phytoene desaturase
MKSEKEKIVVIGAGLAGLAAARVLAHRGHSVVLLDANSQVGGACSSEVVDDFSFNNGAIYVAAPSLLRQAFERMDLNMDHLLNLRPIEQPLETHTGDRTTVHFSDLDSCLVQGPGAAALTGQLRDGLARLQKDWRTLYWALLERVLPQEPSMAKMLTALWPHLRKLNGRADKVIARYFPAPVLQAAIASTLLYTGRAPNELPAGQIIGLIALLEEGFHMPVGGMGTISAVVRNSLPSEVEIRLNVSSRFLDISDAQIHSVELDSGERIRTSRVISTLSGFDTVQRLRSDQGLPRSLSRVARTAPMSHRAVAIQLGCTSPTLPESFLVQHVPDMKSQGEMHRFRTDKAIAGLAFSIPSNLVGDCAPQGKTVIEMYAPVSGIQRASEWTREMTTITVDTHLRALESKLPGLKIDVMRVLDPNDFAATRHLHEGALYGIAPGAAPHQFFPHRSGIQGLYLAGQTTFPGYGVATSLLSGVMAAEALLRDMSA